MVSDKLFSLSCLAKYAPKFTVLDGFAQIHIEQTHANEISLGNVTTN
jgi:hypothetical protein